MAAAACEPAPGEDVAHRSEQVVVLVGHAAAHVCSVATGTRAELDRGRVSDIVVAGGWVTYVVRRHLRLFDTSNGHRFELDRLEPIGIEELVLAPDGTVAWIRIRERRDDAILTARHPGGRVTRVDRSDDPLVLLGLRVDGRMLRWRNGRRRGAARLSGADPCAARRGERVMVDTGEVVVLRDERDIHEEPIDTCVRARGRRQELYTVTRSSTAGRDLGALVVAGRLVAYTSSYSTTDGPVSQSLAVKDLESGRVRNADNGAPRSITDVALTRGGLLTWRKAGVPRSLRVR
jgi:hypothetical protein